MIWNKYKINKDDVWHKYLRKSAISSNVMMYVAIAVIACCIFIDLLNITQLMQLTFDTPSSVIANPMSNLFEYLKPYLVAGGITALIAFCSIFTGILIRKSQTSSHRNNCIVWSIVVGAILFIFAIAVTYYRFDSEINLAAGGIDNLSYDPFSLSLLYSTAMFIGIVVSLIFGIFGWDVDWEAFRKNEEQQFANDKAKYDRSVKVLFNQKLTKTKHKEKERSYVSRAGNVFKDIENIVNQIHCIEDPAEIKSVTEAFGEAKIS